MKVIGTNYEDDYTVLYFPNDYEFATGKPRSLRFQGDFSNVKELVNISADNGFPMESCPPQGYVTLHFDGGITTKMIMFEDEYEEFKSLLQPL